MSKQKCKHQWKKLKEVEPIILIDTKEKQVGTYKTYECTKCGKVEEILDRRTLRKVQKKEILKPFKKYLVGNSGKFIPWEVQENHLLILAEDTEIFKKTIEQVQKEKKE